MYILNTTPRRLCASLHYREIGRVVSCYCPLPQPSSRVDVHQRFRTYTSFKSAGADEKELERLEINEDSVVFVSEEEVGGRRHVIKVGGADVGAMRKEYTHEEGGHIMWLLQIADPAEAQRWISNIKHAILGQRCVHSVQSKRHD